MNKLNSFLVILNLAIVGAGCAGDGTDFGSARPDGGVPAIGPVPPGTYVPPVDVPVSSALIGSGMRSCYASPSQSAGEVAILKWAGGQIPPGETDPVQCLNLASGGSWDICSPTLHWYDGTMLNDNIRQVQGFAYNKKCIKVELYPDWMYGGTPAVHTACAGPNSYSNLYVQIPATTSSIKTFYYHCPNYPSCP